MSSCMERVPIWSQRVIISSLKHCVSPNVFTPESAIFVNWTNLIQRTYNNCIFLNFEADHTILENKDKFSNCKVNGMKSWIVLKFITIDQCPNTSDCKMHCRHFVNLNVISKNDHKFTHVTTYYCHFVNLNVISKSDHKFTHVTTYYCPNTSDCKRHCCHQLITATSINMDMKN